MSIPSVRRRLFGDPEYAYLVLVSIGVVDPNITRSLWRNLRLNYSLSNLDEKPTQ